MTAPPALPPSEVRSYLKRLVLSIVLGVITMSAAAIWAYRTYGARLDQAPPLPEGKPPFVRSSP